MLQPTGGTGSFELELVDLLPPPSPPPQSTNQLYIRVCLKEWQRNIDPRPPCAFGSRVTPIFDATQREKMIDMFARNRLVFPFSFAWPVCFGEI
jgi:hypothetical protein